MFDRKSKNLIKTFYNTFLGLLIKNGNLVSAKKILDKVFLAVLKTTKVSFNVVVLKIILLLNSFVEVKQIKKYKKFFYQVPFSTTTNRKLYLVVKWLINSALEDKRKIPFFEKISSEIILLLTNKSFSKSYQKKKNNLDLAVANKANLHFRW